MKSVSRVKRMEVASEYLLGKSYREVEGETGVSHGSIVNIVRELEEGQLNIEGISSEQVEDLRRLGAELKSSGLKPSQAIHGIRFYRRLTEMGITPEDLDCWSNLAGEIRGTDFQPRDFVATVKRLTDLEKSQGKTFEEMFDEYQRCQREAEKLREEVGFLTESKTALSEATEQIHKESEELIKQKDALANQVEEQSRKLADVSSTLAEVAKEKTTLLKAIDRLQRYQRKISSEIGGREEVLKDLKETGFAQEDLLRLRDFLKRVRHGGSEGLNEVTEAFFSALASYKEIIGLTKQQERLLQKIKELSKQKDMLAGSIDQLEDRKARLLGEIDESVVTTIRKIEQSGEEAALRLSQQVEALRKPLEVLLTDVLAAGEAVGMMNDIVKKGELSQKQFRNFISEVQARMRGNTG
ncbi:MAG: hypothetical protein PHI12_05970 [Dehalococcoidales bacterium]|nr:hypothetical protein [Dehalococcoidales bacterium]